MRFQPTTIRNTVSIALLVLVLGALAAWTLVSPDNPLTALFSRKISDLDERVIIGPYPTEQDFRLLKDHQVTTIVSLLDPRLPYEAVLLERERTLARQYDLKLLSFPMTSIFGKRLSQDYEQQAAAAAEAIARETGSVYLHCYLGVHRVKVVENVLSTRGVRTATYLVRKGERSKEAFTLDRAVTHFDAGRYAQALESLKQLKQLDPPARLLQAWATYRIGDMTSARQLFTDIVRATPESSEAHAGLGYCALRENDLTRAEEHFAVVLKTDPNDATGLEGLGLIRYRQGRLEEAARYLSAVVKIDPSNQEVQGILKKLPTASR